MSKTPFPFEPLPPPGSPEGRAEQERAIGRDFVSPDNALLKLLRRPTELRNKALAQLKAHGRKLKRKR